MSTPLTFSFVSQAQSDIRRITNELTDLQRQVGSGVVATDMQGFGAAAGRLVSARSMLAASDARASIISQFQARFEVQAASLARVGDTAAQLQQAIRDAVSANDGRGVKVELEMAFSNVVAALNETWNGQPMFAGERQSVGPIKISTIDELMAATGPDDIFNEAERHQILDLGGGPPIRVAAKASELSDDLFATLRDLQDVLVAAGGTLGQPLSNAQVTSLLDIGNQLQTHQNTFIDEEGRTGQVQKRFDDELLRLQERSGLLTKEVGAQRDADLAEVSVRLNALMVQYEAAAKTFSELSQMTLLKYL